MGALRQFSLEVCHLDMVDNIVDVKLDVHTHTCARTHAHTSKMEIITRANARKGYFNAR